MDKKYNVNRKESKLFSYQHSSKYIIQVSTESHTALKQRVGVNKWWHHFHFWVNYPFKVSVINYQHEVLRLALSVLKATASVAADVDINAQHNDETITYEAGRNRTADWLLAAESSQHIQGIRENLQFIFDGLQPLLDLQRVVQHFYAVCVWVKPHRKWSLDAGHKWSV